MLDVAPPQPSWVGTPEFPVPFWNRCVSAYAQDFNERGFFPDPRHGHASCVFDKVNTKFNHIAPDKIRGLVSPYARDGSGVSVDLYDDICIRAIRLRRRRIAALPEVVPFGEAEVAPDPTAVPSNTRQDLLPAEHVDSDVDMYDDAPIDPDYNPPASSSPPSVEFPPSLSKKRPRPDTSSPQPARHQKRQRPGTTPVGTGAGAGAGAGAQPAAPGAGSGSCSTDRIHYQYPNLSLGEQARSRDCNPRFRPLCHWPLDTRRLLLAVSVAAPQKLLPRLPD